MSEPLEMEIYYLSAENERLRNALNLYAFGEPTCHADDGSPVTHGCKHQNCEFPKCAEKIFPTWDNGRTARDVLEQ